MSQHPVRLMVRDDLERRRLTVALRLVLAIPLAIWLALWSILALLLSVVNWFATLLLGRSPARLHRYLRAYVKFVTHYLAYVRLAASPYPSFDGRDGYPIDVWIGAPERQGRLGVALRLPLAIPALAIAELLAGSTQISEASRSGGALSARLTQGGLAGTVAILAWFAILARGRMPRGLRDAAAYGIGYGAQVWAYLLLLTDRYPDSDPMTAIGELPEREDPIRLSGEDDLRRSRLTVLFRLPLSFPHLLWLTLWSILIVPTAILNWVATLARGRSPAPLHRFLSAYLRYLVSVYAFLLIVANPFPGFVGAPGAYPLDTLIEEPVSQNRWSVLFRILLAIPALLIETVYSAIGSLLGSFGWFSSLARGRMPRGMRNAGAMALRYQAQTIGYLLLLTPSYPYSGPCRSVRAAPELPSGPGPAPLGELPASAPIFPALGEG
jgi:Domain of unknown function (DUF4389)